MGEKEGEKVLQAALAQYRSLRIQEEKRADQAERRKRSRDKNRKRNRASRTARRRQRK